MSDRQGDPNLSCQNCGNVGFRVSNLEFGNGSDIAVRYCRPCGEPYNQSELEGMTTGCLMCGNDYDDPDHLYGCPNSPHFEWGYEVSDSEEETTIRRMLEQRAEAEDCSVRDLLYGEREPRDPRPVYGRPRLSEVHEKLVDLDQVRDEIEEFFGIPELLRDRDEHETSLYTDALVSSMGTRRRALQVLLAGIRAEWTGEDVIVVGPDGAKKIDHETLAMEDYDLYE